MTQLFSPSFRLHPQLSQDTITLGSFALCRLLLMNDSNYPWFILVPQRDDISEVFQLSELDQVLLTRESSYLAQKLAEGFNADKMNIAALGNVVPQLHIHHIVRYHRDPAWPAPIWGQHPAQPYTSADIDAMKQKIKALLPEGFSALDQ